MSAKLFEIVDLSPLSLSQSHNLPSFCLLFGYLLPPTVDVICGAESSSGGHRAAVISLKRPFAERTPVTSRHAVISQTAFGDSERSPVVVASITLATLVLLYLRLMVPPFC